jgi:Mn-dependent DtxR family transcriptional regulator
MQQISGIKFNNSSVSNRLKRLAQDGKIERIKQGHGKSPSEYKRKITMNEPITNVS